MQTSKVANTVTDHANGRTYVIMAPRVLTDGEIYRAIRQEILRRGGRSLAHGETLTLTLASVGGRLSVVQPDPQAAPSHAGPGVA